MLTMAFRRPFLRYIGTYVVVLLIPIGLFVLLFRMSFLEQLRSQATSRLAMEADAAIGRIEAELQQLRSLSYRIELSPQFISIRIQDPVTAMAAQRALFEANFINDLIEEVAYFPHGIRPVYSSSSPYSRETYFRQILKLEAQGERRLVQLLESANRPTLLSLRRREPLEPLIVMVDVLPQAGAGRKGVLIYSLSASQLRSQLESILHWSDAYARLRTRDGELLTVGTPSSGRDAARLNEERRMLDLGLVMEFSVSEDTLLAEWNRSILLLLGALAATLLLSLPLVYLFSWRHYRPIERIGSFLEQTFRIRPDTRHVSDAVEQQIQKLLSQRESLSGQIDASSHLVRRQLLVKMIRGDVHPKDRFLELCREYEVDLSGERFAVVMAALDPPGSEEQLTGLEIVLNASLIHAKVAGVVDLEADQIAAVVVENGGTGSDLLAELPSTLHKALEQLRGPAERTEGDGTRQVALALAVGSVVSKIELVSQSYLEARSALEHRFIRGMNQLYVFGDVLGHEHSRYEYPVAELARLETLVRTIQPDRIPELLTEVFADVRAQNPPLSVARLVSYDCANTMIRAAAQALPGRNAELWALIDALSLARVKTIGEAEEHMRAMSVKLCELLTEAESERSEDSFSWVLRFVDEHAYDSDFSANTVADYCGRSLSGFSHLFRSQTGTTFREYLHRARMERACELLRSTEMPVGEVVREIGYADATSFIRKFKREIGATPAQYRKNDRLERGYRSSQA